MTTVTTESSSTTIVEYVLAAEQPRLPLELIHVPEDRLRQDLGDLSDIVEDVKQRGVREPLIVRSRSDNPADGVWLVIGQRRLEAAKQAGQATVPVTVSHEGSAFANLLDELLENLLRKDMKPSEEGRAFKRLKDDYGLTQPEIAKAVKRSQGHVSKRIKLAKQPPGVQDMVDQGLLTLEAVDHLDELKKVPAAVRNEVFDHVYASAGSLSADAIGDLVNERIAEHQRQATYKRLRHELDKLGVATVEWPQGGFDERSGERFLAGQEHACEAWLTIESDVAEHAEHVCHAAVICPHDQISYLCLDPDSHRQRPALAVVPDDPAEPEPAAGEGEVELDGDQEQEAEATEADAATADNDASAVEDDAAGDVAAADQPQQPDSATAEASGQATAVPAPEPEPEPDAQEAARIAAERAEAERRQAQERARIEEAQRKAEEEKRLRREKRRAHVEARATAERERTAFIADFLGKVRPSKAKRTRKDELIDHQTRQVLNDAQPNVLELACTWLEVEVPPAAFGGSDYWRGLGQHLEANPEQVERVGWALAFATGEAVLRGSTADWTGPKAHAHLRCLADLGYALSKVEQDEMEGLAPSA